MCIYINTHAHARFWGGAHPYQTPSTSLEDSKLLLLLLKPYNMIVLTTICVSTYYYILHPHTHIHVCVRGKYIQTFSCGSNRRSRLCPETTNLHHPFTSAKPSLFTYNNHSRSITTWLIIIIFSRGDSNKSIYSIITLNRSDQ